jgi:hypothetical protein
MTRPTHSAGKRLVLVLGVLLAFAFASAQARAEYQALKIPSETFQRRSRVIALMPFMAPSDVDVSDPLRLELETVIEEELEARGYQVIASEDFASSWQNYSEMIGGTHDPKTGQRDSDKYSVVWDYTTREMQERYHAQTFLDARLFYRRLNSYGFADQPLTWSGSPLTARPTYVNGAWVGVGIYDMERTKLYDVGQALGIVALYALRGRELYPAEELLVTLDRYRKLVSQIFEDLPHVGPAPLEN